MYGCRPEVSQNTQIAETCAFGLRMLKGILCHCEAVVETHFSGIPLRLSFSNQMIRLVESIWPVGLNNGCPTTKKVHKAPHQGKIGRFIEDRRREKRRS
jgi:hypothetical protein